MNSTLHATASVARSLLFAAAITTACATASAQTTFVNYESPQVHPIDVTPDGLTLLAVNTADGVLEVFDLANGLPVRRGAVAVGVDPVSVRARNSSEAWVVNQVSDSVSVIDLASMRVVRTINVGDEPADIVFTAKPAKAFVSLAVPSALVSFDPTAAAPALTTTAIVGAQPRALAVSPDGTKVYLAMFESGNKTTVIPRTVVSNTAGPYGGVNPPPNSGTTFSPARPAGQANPPTTAMIARKNAAGQWMDDNNHNWTSRITWDVVDNDVAVINTSTLAVSYVTGLMNTVAGIGVAANGQVLAVGIEPRNEIRFEPNLDGKFAKMLAAYVPAGGTGTSTLVDFNPHLTYTTNSIPLTERFQSVGDPRGVAWLPDSTAAFVAMLGSNCVVAMTPSGSRIAKIEVGEGPSGVVSSPSGAYVYVLNRFEGSVSTISTSSYAEAGRVSFHDATPATVKAGRKFLFDTHLTSGLGHTSCATCHVDGRSDRVGWDLGDPSGSVLAFSENCQVPGCIAWHPMKGPMTTQTLFGIIGTDPFHWRGEKNDLSQFNVAFTHLQGADNEISATEMASLQNYVASLTFGPNPNRNIDNSLKTSLPIFGGVVTGLGGTGNPVTGQTIFNTAQIFGAPPGLTCANCHSGITGTNRNVDIPPPGGEPQNRKNAPLRDVWRKLGANRGSTSALRGFGFDHNGEESTLQDLLNIGFRFTAGATGVTERRNVEAFLLSFGTETHAGVGQQTTANGVNNDTARINQFITIANTNAVGLIAKGRINGIVRGYTYQGGSFITDRATEPALSPAALLALAATGSEITYTLVPAGSQTRLGVDRDLDTFRDRDELDAGSDPSNAASVPQPCVADVSPSTPDGLVNGADLAVILAGWGGSGVSDLDGNGTTDASDLAIVLSAWGACH